jgi:hypothetical protein
MITLPLEAYNKEKQKFIFYWKRLPFYEIFVLYIHHMITLPLEAYIRPNSRVIEPPSPHPQLFNHP